MFIGVGEAMKSWDVKYKYKSKLHPINKTQQVVLD
jgi:hypothetical protein